MARFLEIAIALFLFSHIFISIFADSQAVLSQEWFHPKLLEVTEWYLSSYHDPLMTPPLKPWFKSLVYSEMFLQLPFFFVGTYAFLARKNWIRIPALMYGCFVTATMFPIIAELWTHEGPGYNRGVVLSFYAPYLVMPLIIVLKTAFTAYPFGRPALRDAWATKPKWV